MEFIIAILICMFAMVGLIVTLVAIFTAIGDKIEDIQDRRFAERYEQTQTAYNGILRSNSGLYDHYPTYSTVYGIHDIPLFGCSKVSVKKKIKEIEKAKKLISKEESEKL